jgi:YbbR domain-containing protein
MRWRELIFDNLWLKIFSVLLAMLIWFAAHNQLADNPTMPTAFTVNDAQRDFSDRPVLVLTLPTDRRLFRVDPPTVSVTVSGPAPLVQDLTEARIGVFVKAPAADVTSEPVPVQVHIPRGFTVAQTRPEAAVVTAIKTAPPREEKADDNNK